MNDLSPLIQPYCDVENFSIEYIENIARMQLENYKSPTTVFLSYNLIAELKKTLCAQMRYANEGNFNNASIGAIYTSAGQLKIILAPNSENFCHIGDEESYEQIEWIRIHREFEEIVLGVDNAN
jgi:hypothetical protein